MKVHEKFNKGASFDIVRKILKNYPFLFKDLISNKNFWYEWNDLFALIPDSLNNFDFKNIFFSVIHLYKLALFCLKVFFVTRYMDKTVVMDEHYYEFLFIADLFSNSIFNFLSQKEYIKELNLIQKIIIKGIDYRNQYLYQKELLSVSCLERLTSRQLERLELITSNWHNFVKQHKYVSLLITSIPFTSLLFLKYNLNVAVVGTIIFSYFWIKIGKSVIRYISQLMQIFFPNNYILLDVSRHYKIPLQIFYLPTVIVLNLTAIYYIFKLANEYCPTLSFLGIIFFITIKYVIFEKIVPLIIPFITKKYKKHFKVNSIFGFFND